MKKTNEGRGWTNESLKEGRQEWTMIG